MTKKVRPDQTQSISDSTKKEIILDILTLIAMFIIVLYLGAK